MLSPMHVRHCDCEECLPGFPAAPTQVHITPKPTIREPQRLPKAREAARDEAWQAWLALLEERRRFG